MEILKGFCSFNDLALNGQSETAVIGELSPISKTFSRNIQVFSADPTTFSDIALHIFSYRSDNGVILTDEINDSIIEQMTTICDWINTGSRDGTISSDVTQFSNLINSEFGTSSLGITVTEMVTDSFEGQPVVVPKFIEVIDTDAQITTKLWFSNGYFEKEYDEYELVVVPPVKPIDQLVSSRDIVKPLIDSFNVLEYNQNIYAASTGLPYTIINTVNLTWHELDDNTLTIENNYWTTLVYGPRGNNADVINDNLIAYILDNSVYPEDDWTVIYPDLFIKDEYSIIPLWDSVAIGEHLDMNAIYSPMVQFSTAMDRIYRYLPNYDDAWVNEYAVSIPTLWQSVSCISVGGNRNTKSPLINEEYPDLILTQAGTADYDRMSEETRAFMDTLNILIELASDYINDGTTPLPTDVSTILRSGRIYLSAKVNSATILVLTRDDYLSIA